MTLTTDDHVSEFQRDDRLGGVRLDENIASSLSIHRSQNYRTSLELHTHGGTPNNKEDFRAIAISVKAAFMQPI